MGTTIGVIKGNTRSLDYDSYDFYSWVDELERRTQ